MIKSKKLQLVIVLLLACICAPLLGADPNEAETELKFVIRSNQPPTSLMRINIQSPVESTHYAMLFIRGDWRTEPIKSENAILATSAGRTMSQKQRELVSTLPYRFSDYGRTIGNHTYYRLYGMDEDETKKMVEAFLEALANKADKVMQHYLNEQEETQKKIAEIKKELPEKQKHFKAAESKHNEIKNTRSFPHNSNETYKKAKETMFQMDKTLDILEIELAGIQEKMKVLESYRRTKRLPKKNLSDNTVDKLDQMYVEQMVELRGVGARKKAALGIRNREKEFLNLFSNWSSLNSEVKRLKQDLENYENYLRDVEQTLANPRPEMLPPKIYQNKVTIYRLKFVR